MSLSKFLQVFKSSQSVNSTNTDSGCDVNVAGGIKTFIECGAATIIQAALIGAELQDTEVTMPIETGIHKRKSLSSGSTNSSNSNSSDNSKKTNQEDVTDGRNSKHGQCIQQHGGVKVTSIKLASFAHGLGLRKDDVILTVNDKRVKSAKIANFLMERYIEANAKLSLEVERFERGLIRLDNGGNEIGLEEVFTEDELYCVSCSNPGIKRLKHVQFQKYLSVLNGKVSFGKFYTSTNLTYFKIYHYQSYTADTVNVYVRIQHKESNNCIGVENGKLVLKAAPTGNSLTMDSGLLFKVNYQTSSSHPHAVNFEDITSQGLAIGFVRREINPLEKIPKLLPKTDVKVLFDIFDI